MFREIRFVLLHIGKPHALLGIREANVGKCSITVSGNDFSRIFNHNIHKYFIRVFPTPKFKADPAAATQLESARTKYTCSSLVIFPTV
ncbi:hypothetical protein D3C77_325420 [compost metagenome]